MSEIEITLNLKYQNDRMQIQFHERVTLPHLFSIEVIKKFEEIHLHEQTKMNFEIN